MKKARYILFCKYESWKTSWEILFIEDFKDIVEIVLHSILFVGFWRKEDAKWHTVMN